MADHDDGLVEEHRRDGSSCVLHPVRGKVLVPCILDEGLLDGEAVRVADSDGFPCVRERVLGVAPAAEDHRRDIVVDEIRLHSKLRVAAIDLPGNLELLKSGFLLQAGGEDQGLQKRPEKGALVRNRNRQVNAALHHLLGVHCHALRKIAEPLQDEHVMEAVEGEIHHIAELQDLEEILEDCERVTVLVGDVVKPGDVVEGVRDLREVLLLENSCERLAVKEKRTPEVLLLAVKVADAVPDTGEIPRGAGVPAQLLARFEAAYRCLHIAHLDVDNALRVLCGGDVMLRGELVGKLDCPFAAPERGLRSELDHERLLGVDAPEHIDELPCHVIALKRVDELHQLLIAVGHVAAVGHHEVAELRLDPEAAAYGVHVTEREIRIPCGLSVVAPEELCIGKLDVGLGHSIDEVVALPQTVQPVEIDKGLLMLPGEELRASGEQRMPYPLAVGPGP